MTATPTTPLVRLKRTMPLLSISALVLDTETTGLDTRTDRIVQIGAIAVIDGEFDPKHGFEMEELRWALNEIQAIPDVLGGAIAA